MKTSREMEATFAKKYGSNASKAQNASQQTTKSAGSRSEELEKALYEKYSTVNISDRRQKVSNWADKYNRTIKGISDYTDKRNGGYTEDVSGGYRNNVEELLNEFADIQDYASRSGLPNAQRYYRSLLDLRDYIVQENEVMKSRSGLRAYENELRAAMERNEQLRELDKMADYAFDPGSPSANFMQLFRQYQNDESYRAITDNWTEEDRYTLGLLQQEDPEKAREFAIERNNYYNAQATDPMRQQIRDQAPGNILGNTGKALLAGMAGAGEIFDRLAETAARGQTTEKGYITTSDYAQETTGAISEYLNQKYGTVNTENFQNLRDIGQQGLRDANVDPTYIGGAGNGLLDLARDVVDNKGVGDLYNFGYSLAQNLTSRYTLGNIGGQPLVLANYFANAATSAIDDARRRGASGSQAMGIGLIKGALEVGTEFIPTSELFKMGPAVTVKDFLKSVGVEALEEFVGEGANALGGYIADKAIMGNLSEFETAKRKYMEEQGMTEEQAHAQAIKDAITNIVSEGISGALSGAISGGAESAFKTGLANQYYRNINPQTLIDEGMNTEQGSDAYRLAQQMQERVDNDQRVSGNQKRVLDYELRKLAAAKVAAETAAENQPAAQEQESKKPAEKPAVSKEGKSIQISTESPIDTMDFAEIKNGKATIQLKDGGTVDYSDVSFATEAEANQYYAVSTLPGIETEAANDLLHTIQEAGACQDDQGIIAVREAYRLGYAGAQASELARSDASVLPSDLQQKVFEIGQNQRRADAMAKPTVRETVTKSTEGYKKVVIEGKISKDKKNRKKWDSEIAFMDYIADNFSGNAVHVYESYKGRDGKYYYRDSNGKVNRAPNGRYVNGEIWVDLRSGDNQEGLVLNTFAHEMYHHIERFDKAKAQELAEFVVKELGMESVDKAVEAQIKKARKAGLSETYFMNVKGMTEEQARNEVYMRAMSDFVADSLETMFTRGDPAKAIADLKKENRTLFDQIKAFIDKWVSKLKDFYKDKTVSEEGAVVAQLKNFEQLQQLFMEGVQSAGENYRAAVETLTPGDSGEVFNEDGEPVAMSTEDGSVMLSVRTYEEEGRKVFRDYLQKCVSSNRLTKTQMQEMIDGIEDVYQICKEFKDKYAPFSKWSDAEVIRDTRGRPVFSVVTPNGDYKMNLDFSLVCKKRRTLDAVFNEMSRRGIIDDFELGQKSVVKINEIIRKYGLETACALCFVDAKRFRQASMADSFTSLYNELVESLVPEDQKGSIDHFNFSGYETIKKVEGGIDTWNNSKLDFSHLDDVMKRYGKGTVEHKAARYIKNNPKGRKLLLRGDFMSSQGFDAVKTQNRDILKLYNSKKGTGGPKAAFGDVQYLNEIIKKERTWTPKKAYEVGGIRIQSFSDYVPRMVFDYTQMIYDLAARKLPAHAYTKESLFVKQFGLTGVKINMSLIPAISEGGIAAGLDANGNYVWAGESFDYDTAVEIQNAEGYTENCGTICVGVSKQHIEKLLRDPNIRMVIPYHKSGLNPIVAHMNKIAEFTDYTSLATNPGGCQNTVDKDGKRVEKDFNFNEAVKRTGDPKAAADAYLKWCMANGYTAKFAEFASEENYYKLLEDFTLYDKNGKYVPQREVRAVFPSEGSAFGTMKDLIKAGLEEDAVVEGKRDSRLSSIVDEIQRTLPKTEAEIGEEQVAQADKDLEAFSLRNEKAAGRQIERLEGKLKTQKQESLDKLKSYKAEQKELIKAMQQEQRVIREELTGKASDVTLMEKEFIRLVKQYEKLDAKTGKKTIKDTKTIVDLKAALKAEARSHREDSKIWEREFNRLLRDYETAGRQIERLEATILRQRATAKARVEGRRKTEMRHKIQRKAGELNRLLAHGTKHRNIPENLQPVVADILNAINMEVRDGEQRRKTYEATIARYDRQIAAETNPARVTDLINKRNEYAAKGDQFANNMAKLKEVYDQIRKDENSNVQIDDGLAGLLDTLFEKVGDTPLGQMTMDQLEAVNDVLNITRKTIVEANKLFLENQRQGVEETSKNAMREIRTVGGGAKKTIEMSENVKKFGWNNLKPVYVFEAIGSKVMTGLFNNLRKGEDTLARDLQEGRTFFQNQWQKHKGENWDREQKWTFTSTSGKRFELDLMQIMSLYALSKRDQARDHLRVGGFSFDSQYKVKDEIKIGPIKFKADVKTTDASAYNLSDEILGEIIGKLTAEQRAFVDEMQSYLSDTMAAKGNEISMQKYGIRLFKEKNYFPLQVSDQFMAKAREQQTGDRKLKNSGFTKETTPNAKNPVVLSSFLDVWAEHVDEMSLYHSFVLPLDDMSRVLNYHDAFVEENAAASVVEAIRTAYGEGATKYIDQLIRDINGGARTDSVASTVNKMMSTAKKAQTMGSLSVAIQQPSAILRACSEIEGKYFLGRKVTEKMHDTTWAEIKKHAPIAIIKEMGGFDTNVGKSTVEYLTDTANYEGFGEKFKALFTDSKFRDDTLGRLPALMDEMAWGAIWNAVKREQADKHPNMDVKSDAFMKIVADRFTDVIVKTQVYDSVFSRSGMMRSKDTGVKMTTAFMAEPTTTANMLAMAILKAKRGEISKADAAKTVGAIVASLALNAALVSVVYAMRDDDDDKRYDEKWVQNFRDNFFESLDPRGYIPILRDLQSMAKGFDVERADMALFGDLMNAIQGLKDEKRTAWEKAEAVIGSVGNLFGVPLKNIIRDGKGVFKTIAIAMDEESKDQRTKTGRYMARRGLDLNNGEEMLLAIQRGDEEHIQRVFGRYENQQQAESALQSAIREKYVAGDLTTEEAAELLTTNFDRDDENEVYWILDSWDYAKDNKTSEGYAKYGKFLEGVEDGDFQDEMDRLMEHGADASDIRSQITRKYRKQYLEDESAREGIRQKLQPVFEATGMDDDEIAEKFNDWDFEAEYGMTYSAFKSEYKAGNVTEAEMREAMDFYGMLDYEVEEGIRNLNDDIKFEKKFGISLSEMEDAYDNGDVTRNTLISALQYSGMTKKEAQKTVNQRDIGNRIGIDYANLGAAYTHGDISRQTLYNALVQNGATKQEADEAIVGYDWLKKHVKKYPDLTISDAKKFAVRISVNQKEYTLTDYGVTIDSYIEYTKRRAECTGVDADGDGQIDSGTLRDEIFRMIDSLPISSEAKDGLAQIGYSIKSIRKNAPWH